MQILKFGGSSIQTVDRICNVIDLVAAAQRQRGAVVVVSAFGSVTNDLINAAELAATGNRRYEALLREVEMTHLNACKRLLNESSQAAISQVAGKLERLRELLHGVFFLRELSPRTRDVVMCYGERLSAFILSAAISARGIASEYLNTCQVILSDASFGDALVDRNQSADRIRNYFSTHPLLQVATGFIASTPEGEVTTLGRSGSDYTAAILGAALDADEIQIWTDVNGVMTSDPTLVPNAFSIPSLSYEEAMEMAHFGSRVIHPKAMQPAMETGIPIRIRNTFEPEFEGTVICANPQANNYPIRGISSIAAITLLRVQGSGMMGVAGISARLFNTLAREKINVILITQGSSEHSICIAVMPDDAKRAKDLIEREFSLERQAHHIDDVIVEAYLAILAVVGNHMRGIPGIAGKVFSALGEKKINVVAIAQGSSELNISIVISQNDVAAALNTIHQAFFEN